MKKEDIRLLGLGSILKAQTAETTDGVLYVVVARALLPEGGGFTARYRVAPHPFGDAADQTLLVVREDEIREVVFEGYLDTVDEAFIQDLIAKIDKTAEKPMAKAVQAPEAVPVSHAVTVQQAVREGMTGQKEKQKEEQAQEKTAAAPEAEDLFAKFR